RILAGVEMGDRFIDNAWTEDFKSTRALLVARMRRLNPRSFVDPEPIDAEQREALVEAFLSSPFAPAIPEADPIADYCLDPADPKAVEAWMEAFNNRPFEERDAFFDRFSFPK